MTDFAATAARDVAPLDTEPLPLTLADRTLVRDLLIQAGADVAVRAAFRYDRKGYEAFDDLGREHRNPSYGSPDDAIVVSATFVVRGEDRSGLLAIRDRLLADAHASRIAEQEALVAAKRAELAAAEAALAAAREG